MPTEKIIDEDFVRTQIQELCRERRGEPDYKCERSTPEAPASWQQCAGCVGSSFIGLGGFYRPGFACPVPDWCDEETQQVLNTCLHKSLTNIDWLLHLSQKRYRDHASHQLFVGTLGWFLLHCLLDSPSTSAADGGRQTLKEWIAKRLNLKEEDVEVAWCVSSLLHDHAYPLAHMLKVPPSLVGQGYSDMLDRTWALMGFGPVQDSENDSASSVLEGLYDPELLGKLLEAVKHADPADRRTKLRSTLKSYLDPFFNEHEEPGQDAGSCYDHGILGAANLAALIPCSRDNEILKVAIRAIGIHNGAACHESVSIMDDPLAFLLILCDEWQEWGRRVVVGDEVRRESQQIRLGDLEKVGNEKYRIGKYLTVVFEYSDECILDATEWNYTLFRRSKEKALERLCVSGDFPVEGVKYYIWIPHERSFLRSETCQARTNVNGGRERARAPWIRRGRAAGSRTRPERWTEQNMTTNPED